MPIAYDDTAEWLEADGLGGFASGTATGIRTRRYHNLLIAATNPPTGRFALVAGFEAIAQTKAGAFHVSSDRYAPGVIHPLGALNLVDFTHDPWPRWVYRSQDGVQLEHELFMARGAPVVCLRWRIVAGAKQAKLRIRPFLSGRDYHALHHENGAFDFTPAQSPGRVMWRPYPGVPEIVALHSAEYEHAPAWYKDFQYDQEQARGFERLEDLGAPGVFHFDLAAGDALMIFAAGAEAARAIGSGAAPEAFARLRAAEHQRRSAFPSRLHRSADAYIVRRGAAGRTILAGYPWFTDWGRDTFIALPGLCLATGRIDDAREILLAWAAHVSEGMLPNRFPDRGETPEYNSVDASLWFIDAVERAKRAADAAGAPLAPKDVKTLDDACLEIVRGYARGTRYGIRMDDDGLLAAGVPGVQLTWMDAKVGDWVVTPRIGKPVEIQALWLSALRIVAPLEDKWRAVRERALASFESRFWNESESCLFDVVDADHQPGKVDGAVRPNQILAVGGVSHPALLGPRARQVVDRVERDLLTPLGLRSLAPGDPSYRAWYEGGPVERDGAYHQGTVWAWLLGPFVEAWLTTRGGALKAKERAAASARFLTPLMEHLDAAGLGHVSEIADGDRPHTARGAPFQAWSVAAALRIERALRDGEGPIYSASPRGKARDARPRVGAGPIV